MNISLKIALGASLGLVLFACGSKVEQKGVGADAQAPGAETLRPMFASWPKAPEPAMAPNSAMVKLGERLYHEGALSAGNDISCASCHSLDSFGQDNKATSPGTSGLFGKRSTPSSFNAFRQFAQFWDGRAKSVEEQSTMPMMTGVEHGLVSEEQIVGILREQPGYDAAFAAAFPDAKEDAVSADHVRAAIGAFERTLITRSPFDAWVEGSGSALSASQLQGLETFVSVGCATCHMTRAVGGSMYQKLGLVRVVESTDQGRFEATGKEVDRMLFKVPSLLNVSETGPYLHDGRLDSLAETVEFMARVQLGNKLDAEQTAAIVEFLKALTGEWDRGGN